MDCYYLYLCSKQTIHILHHSTCNSPTTSLTFTPLYSCPRFKSCNITHDPRKTVFAISRKRMQNQGARFQLSGKCKDTIIDGECLQNRNDTPFGGAAAWWPPPSHSLTPSFSVISPCPPVSHTNDALAGKATISVLIKTAANSLIKKHQRECTFLFDENFSPLLRYRVSCLNAN